MSALTYREEIEEVLKEEDSFRLAIQGQAALEDAMFKAIDAAFPTNAPSELARLPLKVRVALLTALTDFSGPSAELFLQVAKIRNDFAHGRMHDLTPSAVKPLATAILGLFEEDEKRKETEQKLEKFVPDAQGPLF